MLKLKFMKQHHILKGKNKTHAAFTKRDPLSYLMIQSIQIYLNIVKDSAMVLQNSADEKAVHDLRVYSRRIRWLLTFFKEYIPVKTRKIQKDLSILRDILGQIR